MTEDIPETASEYLAKPHWYVGAPRNMRCSAIVGKTARRCAMKAAYRWKLAGTESSIHLACGPHHAMARRLSVDVMEWAD